MDNKKRIINVTFCMQIVLCLSYFLLCVAVFGFLENSMLSNATDETSTKLAVQFVVNVVIFVLVVFPVLWINFIYNVIYSIALKKSNGDVKKSFRILSIIFKTLSIIAFIYFLIMYVGLDTKDLTLSFFIFAIFVLTVVASLVSFFADSKLKT